MNDTETRRFFVWLRMQEDSHNSENLFVFWHLFVVTILDEFVDMFGQQTSSRVFEVNRRDARNCARNGEDVDTQIPVAFETSSLRHSRDAVKEESLNLRGMDSPGRIALDAKVTPSGDTRVARSTIDMRIPLFSVDDVVFGLETAAQEVVYSARAFLAAAAPSWDRLPAASPRPRYRSNIWTVV